MVLVGVVKRGDRAEVALEIAAASELHQGDVLIRFAGEDLAAQANAASVRRPRPSYMACKLRCRASSSSSVQTGSASPTMIASASGGLVRQERDVVAAHDHRYAARPKLPSDLVRAQCRERLDAKGHQVGRVVEGNLLDAVVVEAHLDVGRRQSGEQRHRQRLHLPGADVGRVFLAADRRIDQSDTHGCRREKSLECRRAGELDESRSAHFSGSHQRTPSSTKLASGRAVPQVRVVVAVGSTAGSCRDAAAMAMYPGSR